MICWNYSSDLLSSKDFIVYNWDNKRLLSSTDKTHSLSRGCCCKDWIEGTIDDRLFIVLDIILEVLEKEEKMIALFEIGKIQDFGIIRRLAYYYARRFNEYYVPDQTLDEFVEEHYYI